MIFPYSFHPNADRQQNDIWFYTYQKWGIDQADSYIDGLHNRLVEIVEESFSTLRDLPQVVSSEVKFFKYGSHYVFVKILNNSEKKHLFVLSILHKNTDYLVRINAELNQLFQ